MSLVRINSKDHHMDPPSTTALPPDIMLHAYLQGVELVKWSNYHYPHDTTLAADLVFLQENQAQFLSNGRSREHGNSFHNAAMNGDYNLKADPPGKNSGDFSILTQDGIPLWVGPIIEAYGREVASLERSIAGYKRYYLDIPKELSLKHQEILWRHELFLTHSVEGKEAINESSPPWLPHAERTAYAFSQRIRFTPDLPGHQARERDLLEAVKRMHGPVLILAR